MPREQRPLERECVVVDEGFIDKTSDIVGFLCTIFADVPHIAAIIKAQADGDVDTLIKMLIEVQDYCELKINELKEL